MSNNPTSKKLNFLQLVSNEEEQIVSRDENSWLIDGATPLEDVMRALDIESFPDEENYETISGFMMYMLRKIPKKTDAQTLTEEQCRELIASQAGTVDTKKKRFTKGKK